MRLKASCSRESTRSARITRTAAFEYVNKGGYYHSLPGDPLREFIDTTAEVQRAMGFENEKDHPEVAPSQFEINYTLWRGGCRGGPDSAVQADLPAGCDADGDDGELSAEAGCGRKRKRHAHERVDHQGRQEPVLGSEGRGEDLEAGVAVYGSHSDAWQRSLPAAECQRECVSSAGSSL